MRFGYSRDRIPYERLVPVLIFNPAQTAYFSAQGKLDTGADITVIPSKAPKELNLFPHSLTRIIGSFDASVSEKPVYYVVIKVGDEFEFGLKALAWEKDYCLIGRDLLNQLVLYANGPVKIFEITKPG